MGLEGFVADRFTALLVLSTDKKKAEPGRVCR